MSANDARTARTDFSFLPHVEFTELDTKRVYDALVTFYESITGKVLYPGDPVRLFLSTLGAVLAQRNVIQDQIGKLNLLRYATGPYLDHLGALLAVTRLDASHASCTVRFAVAAPVGYAVAIPAGTRVTADAETYFATTELAYLPAGETFVDLRVEAQEAGAAVNGLVPGQINRLVDPLAVVITVGNITESAGGADVESDDSLRDRIHLAPEQFTVAGSEYAYIYHALSARPGIADVVVDSPVPGQVKVYVLLDGGTIPTPDGPEIAAVNAALSAKDVRPLTDQVEVLPPVASDLDYRVTWYLDSRAAGFHDVIAANMRQALAAYESWQTGKIGRDLNPDELIRLCRAAGAKRIVAELVLERDGDGNAVGTEPLAFQAVGKSGIVAIAADYERLYEGGVEDD